jgi:hypothetical protein
MSAEEMPRIEATHEKRKSKKAKGKNGKARKGGKAAGGNSQSGGGGGGGQDASSDGDASKPSEAGGEAQSSWWRLDIVVPRYVVYLSYKYVVWASDGSGNRWEEDGPLRVVDLRSLEQPAAGDASILLSDTFEYAMLVKDSMAQHQQHGQQQGQQRHQEQQHQQQQQHQHQKQQHKGSGRSPAMPQDSAFNGHQMGGQRNKGNGYGLPPTSPAPPALPLSSRGSAGKYSSPPPNTGEKRGAREKRGA